MFKFPGAIRYSCVAAALLISGCTVHPAGESQERSASIAAGKAFESETRAGLNLPDEPTRDECVDYALRANADLQQQYWRWRSAIEQITLDGTQPTGLAISLGTTLNKGAFAIDRTVLTAANDPMTDIAFPGKLSVAAQRSLDNSRAAGLRFRQAQFELRRKVIGALDDYALSGEMVRLGQADIELLQTTATITEARSQSGMGGQQNVLKAENEVDLASNELEKSRAQLIIHRATINAMLNRPRNATIAIPSNLPATRPLAMTDDQLLATAAKRNPELRAQSQEILSGKQNLRLAQLQYYPDFDLAASTDLKGLIQSLLGEFTVPIFRAEALRAGVQQARANLLSAEAMHRQAGYDLEAKLMDDIVTLHDADRQIDLIDKLILPRTRQMVALSRTQYQTGAASLLDLLDSQRSLIDLERLLANLRATRDERLAEIEAADALELSGPEATTTASDRR